MLPAYLADWILPSTYHVSIPVTGGRGSEHAAVHPVQEGQVGIPRLRTQSFSSQNNHCFTACSVTQLVVRWLAVRQARVRISALMEVTPTEPAAVKTWRWASANVYKWMLYECIYCTKEKQMQKEWHTATKPLLFVLCSAVIYSAFYSA